MDSSKAQVKGPGLISTRDWLDARLGAGHFLGLAREVDPQFPERIMPGDWYSIRPLIHVLQTSAAALDDVDSFEQLVEIISAENARQDLRGIYRAFLWVASPKMFLRAAPTVWGNYADFGSIVGVENEAGRYVARLTEIPRDLVEWVAGAWKGFLPPAVELAGGKHPRASVPERKPSGAGGWEIRYELIYDV